MISGINFLGQITPKYNLQAQKPALKPMECDCFVKSTSENSFIKWAKENDFMQSNPEELFSEKNLLGKGFSNSVYKIDGNDEFVLRVSSRRGDLENINLSEYKIYDTEDKKLKGNFGQCIAVLNSDNNSMPMIEVLKKQQGITNANPPASAIYHEDGSLRAGETPYESRERKDHYARSMQILAGMPQEAYDKVVKDLCELGELGYKFDYYNPNNFMLDDKEGHINIIDLEKASAGYVNDLGNALWALSDIEYLKTYMSQYDGTPTTSEEQNRAFENTMTIIDKYVTALKNNNKKFSRNGYEFYTQLLGSMPMSFYLRAMNDEEKCQKLAEMGVLE